MYNCMCELYLRILSELVSRHINLRRNYLDNMHWGTTPPTSMSQTLQCEDGWFYRARQEPQSCPLFTCTSSFVCFSYSSPIALTLNQLLLHDYICFSWCSLIASVSAAAPRLLLLEIMHYSSTSMKVVPIIVLPLTIPILVLLTHISRT